MPYDLFGFSRHSHVARVETSFRRTQRGDNNAYCQDNEMSWFDRSLLEKHTEIQRFTRGMIGFRRAHAPNGGLLEWTDERKFMCLIFRQTEPDSFLLFNADTRSVDFAIPALPTNNIWRLTVDTSRTAPDDLFEAGKQALHARRDQFSGGTSIECNSFDGRRHGAI
jgi:isoamylase